MLQCEVHFRHQTLMTTYAVLLLLTLLGTTAKTEHQVKRGLLLNVIVTQSTSILELLAGEDKALLIRGNTLLILDFALHSLDGVRRFHLEGDGFARKARQGQLFVNNSLQWLGFVDGETHVLTNICILTDGMKLEADQLDSARELTLETLLSVQRPQRWSRRQKRDQSW